MVKNYGSPDLHKTLIIHYQWTTLTLSQM